MSKAPKLHRRVAAVLALSVLWQGVIALTPQDIAGGASAFQGQDIMGGAAVIFKRPQRVRDLAGGASMAIVKKSKPPRRPEVTEIARNTPPNKRQPRVKAVETETPVAK